MCKSLVGKSSATIALTFLRLLQHPRTASKAANYGKEKGCNAPIAFFLHDQIDRRITTHKLYRCTPDIGGPLHAKTYTSLSVLGEENLTTYMSSSLMSTGNSIF